ncbi:VOC family protein [Paeniglutamicibacter antarcticus]|uniref:VOC family protein n=2 Tax=Arthrobacter terrae TaxID=2935737 RepID=A0A931CS11_9MICC|nr:VOC family protein [Arthrobacter terrae]
MEEFIMLTRNNLSSIYVLDQDEALTFYTEVLGLEVSADMNFGPMRWLTVRVPGDQKEILLERPGAPAHDEATAAQVRDLVTKGAGGGWLAFTTDDVRGTFEKFEAAGTEITQEPMDQPYGTDFAIRDPFGNNIRIGSIKHWDQQE